MNDLLRDAMPPMNTELRRDLWPAMRERLQRPRIAITRFDWALIAAVIAAIAIFPQSVLTLLYHL